MKKVLFIRNYKSFTGGHLKVWHYYNHVKASFKHSPFIYFTSESNWDSNNPFLSLKHKTLDSITSFHPDIIFLAGKDWQLLPQISRKIPIINLIQHVRHANPRNPLYSFLPNKAIRICVSKEVEKALVNTKITNGPIFTIPNGLDYGGFPRPLNQNNKIIDVLLLGLKNKKIASKLYQKLQELGINSTLITDRLPRGQYLAKINAAKFSVFFPNVTEGFYLPALEAMALESIVICPDCIGNREFCVSGVNCIQPQNYEYNAILEKILSSLNLAKDKKSLLISNAYHTVKSHTLTKERESFLSILENAEEHWQQNIN